jgi:predicted acyl esterase
MNRGATPSKRRKVARSRRRGLTCLEDVDANERVIYLTDGQLRARSRCVSDRPPRLPLFVPHHSFLREDAGPLVPGEVAELRFGLLPISALVRKGYLRGEGVMIQRRSVGAHD